MLAKWSIYIYIYIYIKSSTSFIKSPADIWCCLHNDRLCLLWQPSDWQIIIWQAGGLEAQGCCCKIYWMPSRCSILLKRILLEPGATLIGNRHVMLGHHYKQSQPQSRQQEAGSRQEATEPNAKWMQSGCKWEAKVQNMLEGVSLPLILQCHRMAKLRDFYHRGKSTRLLPPIAR